MKARHNVVFLLDVDNTLLDNDQVERELRAFLEREVGAARCRLYWAIFEDLRGELGYADYLGALQRYRLQKPRDVHLIAVSRYLLNYPFEDRLYPGALDVIPYLNQWGPTVILTDGDVVFQPRKVDSSGLSRAVNGRVLIYVHKEQMLGDVEERYPSQHYVMFDDKLRILAAMQAHWRERLTTVFVNQGHYAVDPANLAQYPAASLSLDNIAGARALTLDAMTRPLRSEIANRES